MSAAISKYRGLIRVINVFFLSAILAGCATTGLIDPGRATIDPNSSVIAFSVETAEISDDKAWLRPKQLQVRYGNESITVRLHDRNAGLQRILLEVPAQDISLNGFELDAGTGIFWNRYRTGSSQSFSLSPGEITYVGRIEIAKVYFEEDADREKGRPNGIRLVFSDAMEEDLVAWTQQYKIFEGRNPVSEIVGDWGGSEFLDLWIRESATARSSSYRWRELDSLSYEPMRGPAPETAPQ
ncbi:MAG: hypothetical protein OEM63_05355 [Gammaproteobacteria bacterium]|nr:hypothetical protein [Gammaproteobacteria bacterium]